MILSHSSIAYASALVWATELFQKTTYRLEELDLRICEVTQNLLHLGFLCILENRLLS
jgi:hypothetical protein